MPRDRLDDGIPGRLRDPRLNRHREPRRIERHDLSAPVADHLRDRKRDLDADVRLEVEEHASEIHPLVVFVGDVDAARVVPPEPGDLAGAFDPDPLDPLLHGTLVVAVARAVSFAAVFLERDRVEGRGRRLGVGLDQGFRPFLDLRFISRPGDRDRFHTIVFGLEYHRASGDELLGPGEAFLFLGSHRENLRRSARELYAVLLNPVNRDLERPPEGFSGKPMRTRLEASREYGLYVPSSRKT